MTTLERKRQDSLDALSRVLSRSAERMARERLQAAVQWARFLADGEQWCRVTEEGIEIIPAESRRPDQ